MKKLNIIILIVSDTRTTTTDKSGKLLKKHITETGHNITGITSPLITYDWFPRKVKELGLNYNLPVFPEDYAYYLLSDNETLIMISGIKSIRSNFKFNLKKNKLEKLPFDNNYKLYISSLLKDCGYKDINATYKCSFYKPLISENLIN